MPKATLVKLTVTLTPELATWLRNYCGRTNRQQSATVALALARYLRLEAPDAEPGGVIAVQTAGGV